MREAVSTKVDPPATDEHASHKGPGRDDPHDRVRHGRGEHVAGAVRTRTVDGFWSPVERGTAGTFHEAGAKCPPLHVAGPGFRHDDRDDPGTSGAAAVRC